MTLRSGPGVWWGTLALAARLVPAGLAGRALGALLELLMRRHRELAERLGPAAGRTVLFAPAELPFAILVGLDPLMPEVRPVHGAWPEADAVIRAPLSSLIALLEGRVDGDALFFSRALEVEGESEVVVALRNALEAAQIRLADEALESLEALPGPLPRALGGLVRGMAPASGPGLAR